MAKMKTREWEDYAVGKPSSESNWTNPNCSPFEKVYHIAHVSDALRIFEDRTIRSSLVSDESKLRTTRASVVWLSSNTWVNGSYYGHIRFNFDWRKLIESKLLFWIEAMPYYPAGFRILVTKRDPECGIEVDL